MVCTMTMTAATNSCSPTQNWCVIYPRLYSRPVITWAGFTTLERVSGSYISNDLKAQADDVVWRIKTGEDEPSGKITVVTPLEPVVCDRGIPLIMTEVL